jgi:uncharacterized protein YjiS (DUF1127 family)
MSTIDTIQKGLGGATSVAGPGASAITYRILVAIETVMQRVKLASEKRRTRRSLAGLSDHQLRDIGVTRYDAVTEANRSEWY